MSDRSANAVTVLRTPLQGPKDQKVKRALE
jgi:hypothetical protein